MHAASEKGFAFSNQYTYNKNEWQSKKTVLITYNYIEKRGEMRCRLERYKDNDRRKYTSNTWKDTVPGNQKKSRGI